MHLYVLSRGTYDCWFRWINNVLAQWCYYDFEGKKARVQLSVRPIIPLEISFPEPCLKEVLSKVWPYDHYNELGNYIKTIGKLLGLKPIPRLPNEQQHPDYPMINYKGLVGVMGIGLKKDIRSKTGDEML